MFLIIHLKTMILNKAVNLELRFWLSITFFSFLFQMNQIITIWVNEKRKTYVWFFVDWRIIRKAVDDGRFQNWLIFAHQKHRLIGQIVQIEMLFGHECSRTDRRMNRTHVPVQIAVWTIIGNVGTGKVAVVVDTDIITIIITIIVTIWMWMMVVKKASVDGTVYVWIVAGCITGQRWIGQAKCVGQRICVKDGIAFYALVLKK